MKRLLSIICAAALTITVVPSVMAEESKTYDYGGALYTYETVENEIVITDIELLGRVEDNVVVPDEIDGIPVTTLGEKAFYRKETIEQIHLPDTLKNIGKEAMYGLRYLRRVCCLRLLCFDAYGDDTDFCPFVDAVALFELRS